MTWEAVDRMVEKQKNVVENRGIQKVIEFFLDFDNVPYEEILKQIEDINDYMWNSIESYTVYKHAYRKNFHVHIKLNHPIKNKLILDVIDQKCECDPLYLDFVRQYGFMITVNELYMEVDVGGEEEEEDEEVE